MLPSWLPANTLPRYTAGCERSTVVSGNANAHFMVSLGRSSAFNPASFAGWNRMLVSPAPQLLHPGSYFHPAPAAHGFVISSRLRSTVTAVPRKFATACRSLVESTAACDLIMPLSSALNMAVGVMVLRTETGGIRAPGDAAAVS